MRGSTRVLLVDRDCVMRGRKCLAFFRKKRYQAEPNEAAKALAGSGCFVNISGRTA
jgi:hypothetical protein